MMKEVHFELLLCCARTHLAPPHAARLRSLAGSGIDWEGLISMASPNGLVPLLYHHLAATCPELVPAHVLRDLRVRCTTILFNNLRLTGEVLEILALFEAHGIRALPYKGPALAEQLYGSLTLRQFTDLDILVQPADVPRARDLLLKRGYGMGFRMTRRQDAAHLRHGHHDNFVRADGTMVELHWAITKRVFAFPVRLEDVFARAVRITLGNRSVPTIASEDLLLILCAHASKHGWERLEWISNVAELLRVSEKELDWERVFTDAERLESRRILLLGLFLAMDLLDAPVPEEVRHRVFTEPAVGVLAADVRSRLQRSGSHLSPVRFQLRLRERFATRAQVGLNAAVTLTPDDWSAISIPDSLYPLYYVVRPLRLFAKYILRKE